MCVEGGRKANQHRNVISKCTTMIYLANPYLLGGVEKLVIL
jgi:hypothetical protein